MCGIHEVAVVDSGCCLSFSGFRAAPLSSYLEKSAAQSHTDLNINVAHTSPHAALAAHGELHTPIASAATQAYLLYLPGFHPVPGVQR